MTARVALAGIAVLDHVWRLPTLPSAPGKFTAAAHRITGGGMSATAAVAVAALGGRPAWVGRLGDDPEGAMILALLARHGVDTAAVTPVPSAQTPVSGVFVDAAGERTLAVFPGARLPAAPAFDHTWLDGAAAVLGDPRWPEGSAHLFHLAAARNLPSVLDAETNAPDIVRRLASAANHVVFSRKGLADFVAHDDPWPGLAEAAAALPHATVGVTLGEAGSLWWQDGVVQPLPAPRVAAADTTGCGDTFHGAYALGLAEGRGIMDAARLATAAAALKAKHGRGWDGMPSRAEVDALLAQGWR